MTSKRFAIGPADEGAFASVLERAGIARSAVDEGRVFVGRRRAKRADEVVKAGDVVEVAEAREAAGEVRVLFHEADLVAVDKPAGMPTIPDHGGSAHALVAVAARLLGVSEETLHPTSRLDRGVSGVVVFALSKAAADRLVQARAGGTYERRYVALATRAPAPDHGTWSAPIGRARDPRLRMVGGRDPVPAETRYRLCALAGPSTAMLAVGPKTGRTHQIRVHASHAGAPLLGDRDYGGPARVTLPTGRVLEPRRVALHAARVVVPGARGEPLIAQAPVPAELESLWSALGGDAGAWEVAASCRFDP
jgi:23S rRNA pseudouridine1911/1915/1917 synthase